MRTTITLPDDVHAAVKTLAEASGRPLSEVVTTLIRRGLRNQRPVEHDGGLPSFAVSPRAPMIPGTRASDLLAEEGAE